MGCSHSFPTPNDEYFRNVTHQPLRTVPPLSSSGDTASRFALPSRTWWTSLTAKKTIEIPELGGVKIAMSQDEAEGGKKCLVYKTLSSSAQDNNTDANEQETLLAVLLQHDNKEKIQICVCSPPSPEAQPVAKHKGQSLYEYAVALKVRNSHMHTLKITGGERIYRTDLCGSRSGPKDRVIHYKDESSGKPTALVCAYIQELPKNMWGCRTGQGVDPLLMLLFVVCTARFEYLHDKELRDLSGVQSMKLSKIM